MKNKSDTSNLMDSIKRINRDEIEKEKAIQKPRSFVKERKDKNENCKNLIYTSKTGNKQTRYVKLWYSNFAIWNSQTSYRVCD
jgi:hypothetical protein